MQKNKIKAILFDSGKVFNFPASGNWFITPNFFEYVEKEKFDGLDDKRISHAFKKANKYIDAVKLIRTREEEFEHFIEFYRIFASELPELNLSAEKMYTTALNELGVLPEEAVFVDDNLGNCMGAGKLGIHSVLLCRNKWVYRWNKLKSIGKGYCVINTLKQLNDIL